MSRRIATWKRHVTLQLRDGCSKQYIPSDWLARAPFNVELRTLHVDRMRLDEELLSLTTAHAVAFAHDKVVSVERKGRRILSVKTAGGSIFAAKWFIDSSGFAAPHPGSRIPTARDRVWAAEGRVVDVLHGKARC